MSARTSGLAERARVLLPDAAGGLLAFGALLGLGLGGAGWFPREWRLTILAFAAVAGAALITRTRIALGRLEWLFLGGLALVAAWTASSAAWSNHATTSLLEAERVLVYLSGAAAAFLVISKRGIRAVLVGAAGAITLVSAYGLVDYLQAGRPIDLIEGRLLFEPLGYANGFGAYAAIGLALVLVLGVTAKGLWPRVAAAASAAILLVSLSYTESRGALAALGVGLGVALVLSQVGPRARLAVGVLVVAAVVALDAFTIVASPTSGAHLVGDNRPRYWQVAWTEYEEHPALGSGAGTFYVYWLRDRDVESFSRDAHNLYLEVLAELGPLALAVLAATLALPFVATRPRQGADLLAATAGYTIWLLHTVVDWDWEQPAVTLAGLFCAAALLVAARPPDARELSPRVRAILGLCAFALAALALIRLATGPRLPFKG